ncbi:hypothetical protein CTAYLR_001907 [Chrysophaeum taylorii]|uniref:tRNA-guanine(15) transglycosylase-like domain-containing protein n=1 Tax=Chrysophaeum taylorii TaxID=2483200 RepID=A0AAD7XG71_9STRA|nr:hypothetical protein CTAYLR_001907 [Chrysophaeum taylorii]
MSATEETAKELRSQLRRLRHQARGAKNNDSNTLRIAELERRYEAQAQLEKDIMTVKGEITIALKRLKARSLEDGERASFEDEIARLQGRYMELTGDEGSYKRRKPPSPKASPPPLPDPSTFEAWSPRDYFRFEVVHESRKSRARAGIIHTPHGTIETPCFVPVGTNAALKAVDSRQAEEAGVQLMFCNTYHLLVHPGAEVVEEGGGLHNFMRRSLPIITDSGGFQVFSLADADDEDGPELKSKRVNRGRRDENGRSNGQLLSVTEKGTTFRSYLDGSIIELTPESSVRAQKMLGADIIIPLDELPPYRVTRERLRESVELSHRWMARSLRTHLADKRNQAMYAVVHGGVDRDLRRNSVEFLASLPFDGFAIGGSLGKDRAEMLDLLEFLMPLVPRDKPNHLLGIADPESALAVVPFGVDTMDSCNPTRVARHGTLMSSVGTIRIKQTQFARDFGKIDPNLPTIDSSRAYLHHLFKQNEPLALTLASIHNIISRALRPVPRKELGVRGGGPQNQQQQKQNGLGEPGTATLLAMTWMGATVAYGSLGLVAGALTPKEMGPATRTLCSACVMLLFGFPIETVVHTLGRAASMRAIGRNNVLASTLAARLETLSDVLQALVMATTSLTLFALAWRRCGSRVTPLAIATAPGAGMAAIYYAIRGRKPRAIHGWVPFLSLLTAMHAFFFDALGGAQTKRRFGTLITTWAASAAVVATMSLRALSVQASSKMWGLKKTPFITGIPGLVGIAIISVFVDLCWVSAALAWWAFHSISIRLGLGVVAVVASAMEIAGARCADVGAVVDHAGCRTVGRLTTIAFSRCAIAAVAQATWRAFWFDSSPAGRTRIERQFISILMAYGAFGIAGAVRGFFYRSLASTIAVVAVLLRTLYVSFHNHEPVAFAGAVGLTFGVAVVVVVLVIPSVFESSWGSEAKELFGELAALFDLVTYNPDVPSRPPPPPPPPPKSEPKPEKKSSDKSNTYTFASKPALSSTGGADPPPKPATTTEKAPETTTTTTTTTPSPPPPPPMSPPPPAAAEASAADSSKKDDAEDSPGAFTLT